MSDLEQALERARGGGPQRHRDKSQEQGKLPVRERVARLIDADSFTSLWKIRPAPRRPGNICTWSVIRAPAESTR